jgi:hypothetical protein
LVVTPGGGQQVGPLPVQPPPVLIRKPGAQLADLGAKLGMRLPMIHVDSSGVRFVQRRRSCTVAVGDNSRPAMADEGWLPEVTAFPEPQRHSTGRRAVLEAALTDKRPPEPTGSPGIRIRCRRPPQPPRRTRTGGPWYIVG